MATIHDVYTLLYCVTLVNHYSAHTSVAINLRMVSETSERVQTLDSGRGHAYNFNLQEVWRLA